MICERHERFCIIFKKSTKPFSFALKTQFNFKSHDKWWQIELYYEFMNAVKYNCSFWPLCFEDSPFCQDVIF